MSYKILLFDLDDTLLDFGANEIDSLNKLFHQHGYDFSDELFRVYDCVNKQLWTDYENGNITLDEVLNLKVFRNLVEIGQNCGWYGMGKSISRTFGQWASTDRRSFGIVSELICVA